MNLGIIHGKRHFPSHSREVQIEESIKLLLNIQRSTCLLKGTMMDSIFLRYRSRLSLMSLLCWCRLSIDLGPELSVMKRSFFYKNVVKWYFLSSDLSYDGSRISIPFTTSSESSPSRSWFSSSGFYLSLPRSHILRN